MRMGLLSKKISQVEKNLETEKKFLLASNGAFSFLAGNGPTFLHCLFKHLKDEVYREEKKKHKEVTFEILAN